MLGTDGRQDTDLRIDQSSQLFDVTAMPCTHFSYKYTVGRLHIFPDNAGDAHRRVKAIPGGQDAVAHF